MSANSSAPTRERRGVENQSANSILSRRIGESVESELDRTLWDLVAGQISLSECTPALQAWWAVASQSGGSLSQAQQLERLRWERDYWYFRANNPGSDFYAAATAALCAEAVAA